MQSSDEGIFVTRYTRSAPSLGKGKHVFRLVTETGSDRNFARPESALARILRFGVLGAAAVGTGVCAPAFAQQAAPAAGQAGLEEIVVTAERREEKLRDVPIAVTSFNATALESRNITDIRGIQGFAPNVALVQSPGYQTETDLAIRGGVTINPAPYWDPTVGLYVDGVYIPKAIGNVTDMADIRAGWPNSDSGISGKSA
jgi:outer membrane receptor protein involved in Fe transport